MKTTDIYSIASKLQGLEYNLLKRAVIALGGVVEFDEEEGSPIVPANLKHGPGPCDYIISRLVVDEGGLNIYGYECGDYPSTDEELEIWPSDIYAGWMHYIFDYLPEVEGFDAFATEEELQALITF